MLLAIQIAFNKSVLRKEEETVAINSELSDFLMGMSLEETTFVCINVGDRMIGTQPVCGQLWFQENRRRTATSTSLPGMRVSKEEVGLSGISNALTWLPVCEENDYVQNLEYKRPGQRVIIYPDFLSKLGLALATRNLGIDPCEEHWPVYEAILIQSESWNDGCHQIIIPESDSRLRQREETNGKISDWMEEAKTIAVARYRRVLEDSPEISSSEDAAEYSEYGKEYSDMRTADMRGEDGKPILARATMTTEQANRSRQQGGQGTMSGTGRQDV
jgi:hypothetical protein